MQQVINEIKKFNLSKGLLDKPFCLDNEMAFLLEELQEFTKAKTDEDRIDALADLVVFAVGITLKCGCFIQPVELCPYPLSLHKLRGRLIETTGKLDLDFNTELLSFNSERLKIYINHLLGAIQAFEYDPEKVLLETCKHINSEEGGQYDPQSGKYLKGKRTYQPDYASCKLEIL